MILAAVVLALQPAPTGALLDPQTEVCVLRGDTVVHAKHAGKRLFGEAWGASEWGALVAERKWQRRLIGRRNQRIASARNTGKPDLPYQPRSW